MSANAIRPALTLVHETTKPLKKKNTRRKSQHTSIFRNWIEQITLSMASLESHSDVDTTPHLRLRLRQLRRRFVRVQNEAYMCCITIESKASELKRDRAAYRIPRLMWLMIRIRNQTAKLVGVSI